jgi:hypothetical protein
MARIYAITSIPGLKGGVVTHVDGDIVPPGDELPDGTTSFDLTYWYYPTPADIAAGATPGVRNNIALHDVPVSASNADIRAAIMELRALNRENLTFGSGGSVRAFGDDTT